MGGLIEHLPARFRTRSGFSSLIGIVAFFGYGGWYLIQGKGIVLSLVAAATSGLVAFFFFLVVFTQVGTGFDD